LTVLRVAVLAMLLVLEGEAAAAAAAASCMPFGEAPARFLACRRLQCQRVARTSAFSEQEIPNNRCSHSAAAHAPHSRLDSTFFFFSLKKNLMGRKLPVELGLGRCYCCLQSG
jgi:hypothetical protein